MSESLVVKSRLMGKITIGALKEGAFDTSDASTKADAKTYEVKFEEGDLAINVPGRDKAILRDRGDVVGVLFGDEQPATLQFTANLRDLTNASAETLSDIAAWMTRDPWQVSSYSDYVSQNWPSVYETSAGSDATVNGISILFEITNPGDSGDVHKMVANFCFGSMSISEGDPDTISLSLTCTDGGKGDPTPVMVS